MFKALRYILKKQHQSVKSVTQSREIVGFTMVELMVSLVVATLIITPLLTFVVNIIQTDTREQAKSNSEQDLQSALNFIASDLKQAIYIYDNDGVDAIKAQLPPDDGSETKTPVLVFWKQEFVAEVVPIDTPNENVTADYCDRSPPDNEKRCDDAQVYSLVAYYLIEGNNTNSPWSETARIGRFQIRDGAKNPASPQEDYVANIVKAQPDKGFRPFTEVDKPTIDEKMLNWTNTGKYDKNTEVLIDYVDQSLAESDTDIDCSAIDDDSTDDYNPQLVGTDKSGFYACVNNETTAAQVFIRGNSLGRIEKGATYSAEKSAFFPRATVIIKGRGLLGG